MASKVQFGKTDFLPAAEVLQETSLLLSMARHSCWMFLDLLAMFEEQW